MRKGKERKAKGNKETKRKQFVGTKRIRERRKEKKKKEKERKREKRKGKNFRLSGGRSSTIRGLKLVHAARSTCGHQKVGVSTNSMR